jgi:hypothetical protein
MRRVYAGLALALIAALGFPAHGGLIMGHDALHPKVWRQSWEADTGDCDDEVGYPPSTTTEFGSSLKCDSTLNVTHGFDSVDCAFNAAALYIDNRNSAGALYFGPAGTLLYVEFDFHWNATQPVSNWAWWWYNLNDGGLIRYPAFVTKPIAAGSDLLSMSCGVAADSYTVPVRGKQYTIQMDMNTAGSSVQYWRVYEDGVGLVHSGNCTVANPDYVFDGIRSGCVAAARLSYGQMDYFRISDGPIDWGVAPEP